ncbi:phosphoribosylpyrophosphate synthetase [Hymenobacter fodinae]|uniref:Phosphoribosylpyrophosphate synthetase n=1 Tax=Hymenobacter fodinae TaxID=2510796 RepID=A0A4Z0NYH9_9BACT|nr:phosphoribosylpyrophosphate synthetase [Hymenobacter fodinae]TGE03505.1 phosphoribosylpyrophosphate synthetase [Hymenobacter fodinae]
MKLSETLSLALQQLRSRGYTEDFSLQPDHLYCAAYDLPLGPEQFQVDVIFRFERHSDPGDQSILYAIRAIGLDLRGVLVNAYGVYADPLTAAMEARLRQPLR